MAVAVAVVHWTTATIAVGPSGGRCGWGYPEKKISRSLVGFSNSYSERTQF